MAATAPQRPQQVRGPKATGHVVEVPSTNGVTFAIRFRAYGKRRYLTLGGVADGWTRESAEHELNNVLADVRRGIWQESAPLQPAPSRMPRFDEYAEAFSKMREPELRESTVQRNRHSLAHLKEAFGELQLDAITPRHITDYRATKLREARLSPDSINKTLKLLSQILDFAVEDDELLTRNVAKGKRRRLKVDAPRRTWLESSEQITALIDATASVGRRGPWPGLDRAALATLVFAGLRIGELLDLQRRDVDLAGGRIRVGRAKTDAGLRDVNVLPVLRDELSAYLAARPMEPETYVFGTRFGTRGNPQNLRNRLLTPAVREANRVLAENGHATMSDRITPHSLRRTFASILVVIGEDPVYVMGQLGHTDPAFTLRIYAQQMTSRNGERDRIKELVQGGNWAELGRNDAQTRRDTAAIDSPDPRKRALKAA